MKIVSLSREIYINFAGCPPPVTMRGVALIDGSNVLAVLALSKFNNENFVLCEIKENPNKRMIIEGWKAFKSLYIKPDKSYFAIMDEDIVTAPAFLRHFGFEHLKENIFIYRG